MANWVFHTVRASKSVIDHCMNENGQFDFEKIIPMPEILFLPSKRGFQRSWSDQHWGVEENACSTERRSDTLVFFDTKWKIPVPAFKRLCEMFHDEEIRIECREESGFYTEYKNDNGVLTVVKEGIDWRIEQPYEVKK